MPRGLGLLWDHVVPVASPGLGPWAPLGVCPALRVRGRLTLLGSVGSKSDKSRKTHFRGHPCPHPLELGVLRPAGAAVTTGAHEAAHFS